jgi:hypothetical protein
MRSGLPQPRVELEPHGPHFTFSLRRSQTPSADMWKQAMKKKEKKAKVTEGNVRSKNVDVRLTFISFLLLSGAFDRVTDEIASSSSSFLIFLRPLTAFSAVSFCLHLQIDEMGNRIGIVHLDKYVVSLSSSLLSLN